jgi:hypothetical protein
MIEFQNLNHLTAAETMNPAIMPLILIKTLVICSSSNNKIKINNMILF